MDSPLLNITDIMSRRPDRAQERKAEREKEHRIREAEDLRVQTLREDIFRAQGSEMDEELKAVTISALSDQIDKIFADRAERKEAAIEREKLRKLREVEEKKREENAIFDEEDFEDAALRESIRGLTKRTARMSNINLLSRSRAILAGEAQGPPPEEAGGTEENQNPEELIAGAERLNVSVLPKVGAMYRDHQAMQEAQMRFARGQTQRFTEDNENGVQGGEHENTYEPVVDARL